MDLSNIIQVVSTIAMTLGIVFGILNLRNFQASRKREACCISSTSPTTPPGKISKTCPKTSS